MLTLTLTLTLTRTLTLTLTPTPTLTLTPTLTRSHEALDATTTADTLTLCLDRASARSLLPEDVVAALRRRRDEAYLWADAAQLGAAELQPEKVVARGS